MVGTSNQLVLQQWLEAILGEIPAGTRILDAGAGELSNKKYCTHLNYTSQDFCEYEGSGNNSGLQTGAWDTDQIDIVGDITNIPENDASFDVVLCAEVLEHLPEPVKAIKEFQRLLKKDGILIITAPFCSLTHFAPYHYSTGFNRYFYQHHLEEFGFEIKEISTNGNFFEYLGQELRRAPSIGKKYSSSNLSWIEKRAVKVVLTMLERFSNKDKHSDELLCFGYHVVAIKK